MGKTSLLTFPWDCRYCFGLGTWSCCSVSQYAFLQWFLKTRIWVLFQNPTGHLRLISNSAFGCIYWRICFWSTCGPMLLSIRMGSLHRQPLHRFNNSNLACRRGQPGAMCRNFRSNTYFTWEGKKEILYLLFIYVCTTINAPNALVSGKQRQQTWASDFQCWEREEEN